MLRALLRLIAWLPLGWLHGIGAALGWSAYWLSPVYASRLRENLAQSGVCPDPVAQKKLRDAAIAEAGKGVLELAAVWFRNEQAAADLIVECSNWNLVEQGQRNGKGIIFLTPHLGCFEITALYAALRMPITVLYRPPHKAWLEPLMIAGRQRAQSKVAPASMGGVRRLLKALKNGEAIGLLPDQAPQAGEGTWVDFFGRPAYTMTLVRRLHEATGAAVIYAFAERLARGRGFRLHLRAAPVGAVTEAAMNRAIEDLIRECPAQYLWSYHRYKVPAGVQPPETKAEG